MGLKPPTGLLMLVRVLVITTDHGWQDPNYYNMRVFFTLGASTYVLIFSEKIWSNYSDLTQPHPKWWFTKGNPLISGKSRLVKYYNLARKMIQFDTSHVMFLDQLGETLTAHPRVLRFCCDLLFFWLASKATSWSGLQEFQQSLGCTAKFLGCMWVSRMFRAWKWSKTKKMRITGVISPRPTTLSQEAGVIPGSWCLSQEAGVI